MSKKIKRYKTKAGAAKIKITPPIGLEMSGFAHKERTASGKDSELYTRALVLSDNNAKVAIASCDLLFLEKRYTHQICEKVENETGIPAKNIMICASHTHSGPQMSYYLFGKTIPAKNKNYTEKVVDLISKSIISATENLAEAKVGISSGQMIDGFAENSRYLLKDGTIALVDFTRDEIVRATGPVDPEVGVIHIRGQDKRSIAILYNYSCHACTYAENRYFADYPGIASDLLEKKFGGIAIFTPGACGNIHPVEAWLSEDALSKCSKAVERNGERLARKISDIIQSKNVYSKVGIDSLQEEVSVPLRKFTRLEEEDIKKTLDHQNFSKEIKEKILATYRDEFKWLKGRNKDTVNTLLQVVMIGDGLLVGIPGELFVEFGLKIKGELKNYKTFIVELANDWIGYIPTTQAFKLGGYQTWTANSSKVSDRAGELLVEKSLKLVAKIKGAQPIIKKKKRKKVYSGWLFIRSTQPTCFPIANHHWQFPGLLQVHWF
ncbi:hypothetical protein ES703_17152 [subsurface metagenome]